MSMRLSEIVVLVLVLILVLILLMVVAADCLGVVVLGGDIRGGRFGFSLAD